MEERNRRHEERGGYNDATSDDDTGDDEHRPRLAITEAPPTQGSIQGDPRVFLAQQQQRQEVPVGATPPGQPGAGLPQMTAPVQAETRPPPPAQSMPVPDIKVEPIAGSYSTNV